MKITDQSLSAVDQAVATGRLKVLEINFEERDV